MLNNGAWYELPEGTRVQAIQLYPQLWRLDYTNGQPAYLETPSGWAQLLYDADLDVYAAIPCNLQSSDLVEMIDAE
jgi:hypothetical protein